MYVNIPPFACNRQKVYKFAKPSLENFMSNQRTKI